MRNSHTALLAAFILAFVPFTATAETFQDRSEQARQEVASQSLDNLAPSVYRDAHVTARIIGYDPTAIEQMKREIAQLRAENAQLRSVSPVTVAAPSGTLEARVAILEASFQSLQGSLGSVITMLTLLLSKLQ